MNFKIPVEKIQFPNTIEIKQGNIRKLAEYTQPSTEGNAREKMATEKFHKQLVS